jgi:hypothetical protein
MINGCWADGMKRVAGILPARFPAVDGFFASTWQLSRLQENKNRTGKHDKHLRNWEADQEILNDNYHSHDHKGNNGRDQFSGWGVPQVHPAIGCGFYRAEDYVNMFLKFNHQPVVIKKNDRFLELDCRINIKTVYYSPIQCKIVKPW